MKAEGWISRGIAAALGFAMSFGAVGCLDSGFGMDAGLGSIGFACGFFALAGALCLGLRHGGKILLCVLAVALGYLWREGSLTGSFSALAAELSGCYDRAYGWGSLGTAGAPVDAALTAIGCVIALAVSWTVCRQRSSLPAVLLALLPLASCLVVTDKVPGEGYIFILFLGLLLLIMTNYLRRGYPGQANTLTAMAAVPVALALGVLFLIAPKEGYVNQAEAYQEELIRWVQDIPQRLQELSQELMAKLDASVQPQEVDLRAQGPRVLQTYPIMDVSAAQTGTLYLREQDYDRYDGTGWSASQRRTEEFGEGQSIDWVNVGVVTIVTRQSRDVLYYPYYAREAVTLTGGNVENTEGISIYEIRQRTLPAGWENGLESRGEWETGGYLELPGDTRRRAEELLADILTDERTATQKAQTIASYVRNSAKYDLNTRKMPSSEQDFALWFLEDSDRGYCVHFATATAVLLRAAGVQSRYVTGYMTQGVAGQVVTVTAAEDHAWVEYYEPHLGLWIPLESTPGSLEQQETEPDETQSTATEPRETDPGEVESDGTRQTEAPQEDTRPLKGNTGGSSQNDGNEADGEAPRRDLRWLWGVGTAVAMVMGVAAQRALRLFLRRRRARRGRPNAKALALWREVRLWERATREPAPKGLEQLAQKAKYSQHTLTDRELAEFGEYLRTAREAAEGRPWYVRLACRWLWALY